MTEYFFRTGKATYHPEGDNCGGDWLTHTAGSQCQMAFLPDMVNHSVNPTITETYAMEEVQQHSFTNNNNNSSSQSFTITAVPHQNQRLLRRRKNHFHQHRRTSLAMDRYPWEQQSQQQQDHHLMQDVATESSSCAGMMVALERTAAPQALERHRRKFLEYWDFG